MQRGRIAARLLTLVLALASSALVTSGPAEALGIPGDLTATTGNPPHLSWGSAAGAIRYDVQIDDDSDFSSPEYTVSTYNTRNVPTEVFHSGDQFWRVRAVAATNAVGPWALSSFTITPITPPSGLTPDGDTLQQPATPPLLSWDEVPGTETYVVQIDDEEDGAYVSPIEYTTKATSLVVPDGLKTGDTGETYRWRVKAIRGPGVESTFSSDALFTLSPVDTVTLMSPPDDAVVQDVVLKWHPMPGAATYDLQVSTDDNFSSTTVIDDRRGLRSTTYSPPSGYDNNTYYWRVRAVDTSGNPSAWSYSSDPRTFVRSWAGPQFTPQLLTPADGAVLTGPRYWLQWTPVQHASYYQVQMGTDPAFSPGTFSLCAVGGTTYTPRSALSSEYEAGTRLGPQDGCSAPSGQKVYWRVRPMDQNQGTGTAIEGIYSATRSFTYTKPTVAAATSPLSAVTGVRLALDGNTIGVDGNGGFAAPLSCTKESCDDLPATPVISWQPVVGAAYYMVYISEDPEFTNVVEPLGSIPATGNTIWTPNLEQTKSALAESLAGGSYYVHIRPCTANLLCNASPVSSEGAATNKFRKKSPPVALASPADLSTVNQAQITFEWDDYRSTNADYTWTATGEKGNQSARSYRVQVDNDANFSSPIDNALVEQTTYTAFASMYPEGPLYWRVSAVDIDANDLTWSEPRMFIKSTTPVALTSPDSDAVEHVTTVFRWEPRAYAASYDFELYKNDDGSFSSSNRIVSRSLRKTAYVWGEAIPASRIPYLWRVRTVDPDGNKGPWSDAQSFTSAIEEPAILGPADGAYVRRNNLVLSWTQVDGASDYRLEMMSPSGSVASAVTKATAYATTSALADGTWQWRIVALSGSGTEIGTTDWSRILIDENGPRVLAVRPTDPKPTSTFKITFSEPVKNVSGKTVYIRMDGKRKVRARVRADASVVTLNPGVRLRTGVGYTLTVTSGVTDRHGHAVTPYQRSIYLS